MPIACRKSGGGELASTQGLPSRSHNRSNILSISPFLSPSPPTSAAPLSPSFGPTGLVAAKKSTLIAMAKPACKTNTTISRILLVFASVELRTGYKFLSRKNTLAAKPSATNTKLRTTHLLSAHLTILRAASRLGSTETVHADRAHSLLIVLMLAIATGIHTRFAYPYKQTHSSKFALSLPYHFNTAHKPAGTTPVYPYTSPAAPLNSLKSYAK